jgi:hypothetical protein
MMDRRGAYRILVGETRGKEKPLGRPRRGWDDGNKMDLKEVGWGRMDWIDVVWNKKR